MPTKRVLWPAGVRRRHVPIKTDLHQPNFHQQSRRGENTQFSSQDALLKAIHHGSNFLKLQQVLKDFFSTECTGSCQSSASTTGDPNGFVLSGSQPSDPPTLPGAITKPLPASTEDMGWWNIRSLHLQSPVANLDPALTLPVAHHHRCIFPSIICIKSGLRENKEMKTVPDTSSWNSEIETSKDWASILVNAWLREKCYFRNEVPILCEYAPGAQCPASYAHQSDIGINPYKKSASWHYFTLLYNIFLCAIPFLTKNFLH